jgi:hypothetical protein
MGSKKQKLIEEKKDSAYELKMTIQSAINSDYKLIMPVVDQSVIHLKNPVTKLMSKFKLDSPEYFEFLDQMVAFGLEQKLNKDFAWTQQFGTAYINSWNKYKLLKLANKTGDNNENR